MSITTCHAGSSLVDVAPSQWSFDFQKLISKIPDIRFACEVNQVLYYSPKEADMFDTLAGLGARVLVTETSSLHVRSVSMQTVYYIQCIMIHYYKTFKKL